MGIDANIVKVGKTKGADPQDPRQFSWIIEVKENPKCSARDVIKSLAEDRQMTDEEKQNLDVCMNSVTDAVCRLEVGSVSVQEEAPSKNRIEEILRSSMVPPWWSDKPTVVGGDSLETSDSKASKCLWQGLSLAESLYMKSMPEVPACLLSSNHIKKRNVALEELRNCLIELPPHAEFVAMEGKKASDQFP